jgi:hypothetical protein
MALSVGYPCLPSLLYIVAQSELQGPSVKNIENALLGTFEGQSLPDSFWTPPRLLVYFSSFETL